MEPVSSLSLSKILATLFLGLFFNINIPANEVVIEEPIIIMEESINEEDLEETDPVNTEEKIVTEESFDEIIPEDTIISTEDVIIAEEIEAIKENEADEIENPKIDMDSGDKVKIQIFTDFQCPYCARFAKVTKILHARDDLDIDIINFPLGFHTYAKSAAKAAICAEKQEKLWEMHDAIFANQNSITDEDLQKKAENIELDLIIFDECFSSEDTSKELEKDINYGIKMGVTGTPTSFINGEKVVGALPIENIEKIIRSHQNKQ